MSSRWRQAVARLVAVTAVLLVARAAAPVLVPQPTVLTAPPGDLAGPDRAAAARAATAPARLDEPTATDLLLDGGDGLLRVDLDAGSLRAVPMPGPPPGADADGVGGLVRRDGAVVVVRGGAAWVAGRRGRPVARLGAASYALASTAPRRVWLVEETGDPDRWFRAREVTLDGRVTAAGVLPLGRRPAAAVAGGLLLGVTGADGGLAVWDARSGRSRQLVAAASPVVVAAHRGLVAWVDGQTLHLTDLAGGRDRPVPAPAGSDGFAAAAGAFSPDGRLLAAFTQPGLASRPALALVAVARAAAWRVAGSDGALADRCSPCLAWAPAGGWVFFTRLGPGFGIGAYRVDHARAATVPLDVAGPLPPSFVTL